MQPGLRSALAVPLALFALGGCEGPVEPQRVFPPAPIPRAVVLTSGDHQAAKAGERLLEPLIVRVTDAGGDGIRNLRVTWTLTAGAGRFLGHLDGEIPAHYEVLRRGGTHTSPDGYSRIYFIPTTHGLSTVTASLSADSATVGEFPVDFTIEANTVVVTFGPTSWDDGPKDCFADDAWWDGVGSISSGFAGPDCSSDIVVPVGMPIEFVNKLDVVEVASSSIPVGGSPFDSGTLVTDERFRFVPEVPGTWEYLDRLGGETGTITATRGDWSAWVGPHRHR